MKIKTKNPQIVIDNLKRGDISNVLEIMKDQDISRYLVSVPYPYSVQDFENWFKKNEKSKRKLGRALSFAIRDSEHGLIGSIGFSGKFGRNTHIEDIGYWLDKRYWGQGIMSSVVEAFVEDAFSRYGFTRIGAYVVPENIGSKYVLKNAGFVYEGTLRNLYQKSASGDYLDAEVYSRLKSDNL